jgi:hypothetical protein
VLPLHTAVTFYCLPFNVYRLLVYLFTDLLTHQLIMQDVKRIKTAAAAAAAEHNPLLRSAIPGAIWQRVYAAAHQYAMAIVLYEMLPSNWKCTAPGCGWSGLGMLPRCSVHRQQTGIMPHSYGRVISEQQVISALGLQDEHFTTAEELREMRMRISSIPTALSTASMWSSAAVAMVVPITRNLTVQQAEDLWAHYRTAHPHGGRGFKDTDGKTLGYHLNLKLMSLVLTPWQLEGSAFPYASCADPVKNKTLIHQRVLPLELRRTLDDDARDAVATGRALSSDFRRTAA